MTTRRTFLAGLTASGLLPRAGWADAGAPEFLSAARFPDGSYRLAGLKADGAIAFTVPLPARGHCAAAHPMHPVAVGFARRPGAFAVVLDCVSGQMLKRLDTPKGRHFYGHGAYSADGATLFTTENDFEAGQGVVGVWDVRSGYKRIGEFRSQGVGPHDIHLMPDGETLVIANGGIETHPDAGRAKLNIPTMKPNLAYLALDGALKEKVELAPELHKSSIRHLALRQDGLVAFAMQWQGDVGDAVPLLGVHRRGETPLLLKAPEDEHRNMHGYAGSVAISRDGRDVAISSPRGNRVQVFDLEQARFAARFEIEDVCGLAPLKAGFFFTSGLGVAGLETGADIDTLAHTTCQWDNHIIPISPPDRA
ncbi:DUF1513 domain-containing protein [Aquicoccus sp. G2-2]|uniref:DUF1513 domain-containing protein n=1 Tax=Aquicoccus sp. G2-2 TaxID=3092120 RepID=UPI002AE066AE|nr:DUF1513 domain-containing protein [Aquicoccus sp. G2-2]MEA1112304.1 DUF1513 domain-containing protein [Aquicoccus sp. G2-2]